jgi:hypothetical protein
MNSTLFFWIALAFVGLLFYIMPAVTIRPMYEGFAAHNATTGTTVMSSVAGATTASGPAATTSPALAEVSMNAPTNVQPTTASTNSAPSTLPASVPAAATAATQQASIDHLLRGLEAVRTPSFQQTPEQPATTPAATASGARSQPAGPVSNAQDSGESLLQGAAFQNMKPAAPVVQERVIVEKHYIPMPTRKSCPDMTDYIRKDSIPCWGCKLK